MRINALLIIAMLFSFLTACDLLKNEDIVILTDQLASSVNTDFDIDAPQISQPLKEAKVKGTVQNVSDRTLKNIVITYKFARGVVTAKISSLEPNQTYNFTTTIYKTKRTAAKYELESITYSE